MSIRKDRGSIVRGPPVGIEALGFPPLAQCGDDFRSEWDRDWGSPVGYHPEPVRVGGLYGNRSPSCGNHLANAASGAKHEGNKGEGARPGRFGGFHKRPDFVGRRHPER